MLDFETNKACAEGETLYRSYIYFPAFNLPKLFIWDIYAITELDSWLQVTLTWQSQLVNFWSPLYLLLGELYRAKTAAFTGIFWDMPKEWLGSRRALCLNWQLAGKWIRCEVNPQKCRFLLLRQQRASVQDICCSVIRIHLVTCPSARPLFLYYVSWEPAPLSFTLSFSSFPPRAF